MEKSSGKNNIIQFIKFGLVGVLNTIVSQLIYMICYNILGLHYEPSNIIAFIISVLNAFFLQTRFVFKEDADKEKRVWWQVLIKTYCAYAFTGLFLNSVLLVLWIDIIKIERFTVTFTAILNNMGINMTNHDLAVNCAPLLNIVVNVPINFIVNKFWAYRQKKSA